VSSVVLADRYEALRAAVLERSSSGYRHSLALLLREGMAAWISAWGCVRPSLGDQSALLPTSDRMLTSMEPTPWIHLLASMALSILQEVPS